MADRASEWVAAASTVSLAEAVARAAGLGYDAVEVMPLDAADPDPEALRALAERHRLSITVPAGKLEGGTSREEAWPLPAGCVRECGMYAGELGLTLTIESGNRYGTDFVHTVDEGLALLDAVSLPSVRLQLDTFHMNIEETSLAALQGLRFVRRLFEDA